MIRPGIRRLFQLPRRSRKSESEIDEEIRLHLELRAAQLERQGLSPDAAWAEARRRFGPEPESRALMREAARRRERRISFRETVATVRQDLRFALRLLRRDPGFTAVVLLTLALGIGATTAVFSMVHSVLLRPLPFDEPERLVTVWETRPAEGVERNVVATGNYLAWKESIRSFIDLAAYSGAFGLALTGGDAPEHLVGRSVSPNLFRLLGASAGLGRTFGVQEESPGAADVVLISHGLWVRRFGGDSAVVGRTLHLAERPYRIIGVMPRAFRFPTAETEFWLPRAFRPAERESRSAHQWLVIGRLRPGESIERAQADVERMTAMLTREFPEAMTGWGARVVGFRKDLVGEAHVAVLVMLGAVALVLLIACANVANLLLARGVAREKETALRTALGAGRGRLVRQLLVEALVLALLGGALGLALAYGGIAVLVAHGPADIPFLEETEIDRVVLAATGGAALLATLLFGLVPAVRLSTAEPAMVLQDARRDGVRHRRVRGALLVAEVAIALVLLTGAGLLLRSAAALQRVPYGFNPVQVLAATIDIGSARHGGNRQQHAFLSALTGRLSALPGVVSVAVSSEPPVVGYHFKFNYLIQGRPRPGPNPREESVAVQVVTPELFSTLRIPLLRGRGFEQRDDADAPPIAIVDEEWARRVFPGENPIGRRIDFGNGTGPWFEIVGIVGATRYYDLEAPPEPQIYLPFAQKPWSWLTTLTLLLRTAGDPADLVETVRQEVLAVDPNLPLQRALPIERLFAESQARRRFTTLLLVGFSGTAMLLGAVGLYGALAYAVAQRRREIGIRLALGARHGQVASMVMREGLRLTAVGIALGAAAALVLTRVMNALLYEVGARDPATFIATSALLVAVAALACWVPARRATLVDPIATLRME